MNGSTTPESLVHPDALNEVFDLVDVNGDGVLTVHEFISVSLRRLTRSTLCFFFPPLGRDVLASFASVDERHETCP